LPGSAVEVLEEHAFLGGVGVELEAGEQPARGHPDAQKPCDHYRLLRSCSSRLPARAHLERQGSATGSGVRCATVTTTVSGAQALAGRGAGPGLPRRAAAADLAGVTGDICGVHAQVMSCAELSLWARVDGFDRDAVRQALWVHRSLVKLWAARGTLYLL